MKKSLFLLSVCILSFYVGAQITVQNPQINVALNPQLLGLNGRSTEGPSWTNNSFLNLVTEMNPSYVRYPAGTIGNQWNWKTGTYISGYGNSNYTFTIPMLINGMPTGCKIIYMVNMVLPTEQTGITFSTTTDAVLATDATLNAKIADILNALNEFNKDGHLPEFAELGNELYFNNTEAGVYAANPVLYMTHAKKIATAIKTAYPQIKIILCTTKGGTNSRDAWNNTVFNTLSSDTSFGSMVYGVVQHHYINASYGDLSAVTTNTIAEGLVREGIQYVVESASDYALVPSNLKLMVTEFGCTKNTADGMWTCGLRTANMTLAFMQLGTKVDNLMWHHITDDPNVINIAAMKTGPSGLAFSLMENAMSGMTSYSKLQFSNVSITDSYASLYGFHYGNNTDESILIVNQSSSTYNSVNLTGLVGTNYTLLYARQYWSASLINAPVYQGSNISTSNSTNLAAYNIKPYSITAIRVQKLLSSVNIYKSEIKYQIRQMGKNVTITGAGNEQAELIVTDLTGRKLITTCLNNGTATVSLNNYPSGVYLVSVKYGSGVETTRVMIK